VCGPQWPNRDDEEVYTERYDDENLKITKRVCHVDEERQPVQTAIAIDSDDTMDGILGARPTDTARSSSATPFTLAACDGDAAEKNGDE
jgi:hypothetical protein